MSERIELEVLPAIAGHAHALGNDGQPTCGCKPRINAFHLRAIADEWDRLAHAHNPAITRLQLSSPRCERITFPLHSKCDVGSDVPGGGAA